MSPLTAEFALVAEVAVDEGVLVGEEETHSVAAELAEEDLPVEAQTV